MVKAFLCRSLSLVLLLVDPGVNKVPYFYHDVHE